jgi:hypothetical protein
MVGLALCFGALSASAAGLSNNLLLSSAWCQTASNPSSGSSTTTIVIFGSNGAYNVIQRYVGFASGAGMVLDNSGDQLVGNGVWQVVNGQLYMSVGNDPRPVPIPTEIRRAADGRIALIGSQGEFLQCR